MKKYHHNQYASGYSLDLYCDTYPASSEHSSTTCDGVHAWNEFPHQYAGETFMECANQARKDGWKIHKKTRTATCPKCAK